jgi:hypothetical protein
MGVWEYGSMGVWEYGSMGVLSPTLLHPHTPIPPYTPDVQASRIFLI